MFQQRIIFSEDNLAVDLNRMGPTTETINNFIESLNIENSNIIYDFTGHERRDGSYLLLTVYMNRTKEWESLFEYEGVDDYLAGSFLYSFLNMEATGLPSIYDLTIQEITEYFLVNNFQIEKIRKEYGNIKRYRADKEKYPEQAKIREERIKKVIRFSKSLGYDLETIQNYATKVYRLINSHWNEVIISE